MSLSKELKKKGYFCWIKFGLALKYLHSGMVPFIDDIITKQHKAFLDDIQTRHGKVSACTVCRLKDVLPVHVAIGYKKKCPLTKKRCNCIQPTGKRLCPNKICSEIYDKIISAHRYGETPYWENSNISLWFSKPWEIAKCFIPGASTSKNNSASDTDCTGLLSLAIFNNEVQKHLQCFINNRTDEFSKTKKRRNEIIHSASMELKAADLEQFIDDMILILRDPMKLHTYAEAQSAIANLIKLKDDDFVVPVELGQMVLDATKQISMETSKSVKTIKNECKTKKEAIIHTARIFAGQLETEYENHLHCMDERGKEIIDQIKIVEKDVIDEIKNIGRQQLNAIKQANQNGLTSSKSKRTLRKKTVKSKVLVSLKLPKWDEFRSKIIDISKGIGPVDTERLKYLCTDVLQVVILNNIQTAQDLFAQLDAIAYNKVYFVLECLGCIDRLDIVQKLGFDVDLIGPNLQDWNNISNFRKSLVDISKYLDLEEVENIRSHLKDKIKKKYLNERRTLLEIFTFMEQENHIGPQKFDLLFSAMDAVGRQDLLEKIKEFRDDQFFVKSPHRNTEMRQQKAEQSSIFRFDKDLPKQGNGPKENNHPTSCAWKTIPQQSPTLKEVILEQSAKDLVEAAKQRSEKDRKEYGQKKPADVELTTNPKRDQRFNHEGTEKCGNDILTKQQVSVDEPETKFAIHCQQWGEVTEPVDNDHFEDCKEIPSDYETIANYNRCKQKEYQTKATEEFNRGRREVASVYSDQARIHARKMRDAEANLAELKNAEKNCTEVVSVDLHGDHVADAEEKLRKFLSRETPKCRCKCLLIKTGKGQGKKPMWNSIKTYLIKNQNKTQPLAQVWTSELLKIRKLSRSYQKQSCLA